MHVEYAIFYSLSCYGIRCMCMYHCILYFLWLHKIAFRPIFVFMNMDLPTVMKKKPKLNCIDSFMNTLLKFKERNVFSLNKMFGYSMIAFEINEFKVYFKNKKCWHCFVDCVKLIPSAASLVVLNIYSCWTLDYILFSIYCC